MTQYEYEQKFGELTPSHPFGEYVFTGMYDMFMEEYRLRAKGARTLDGAEMKFAYFTVPKEFSKANALKEITAIDRRNGATYPAMFFTKQGFWIGDKMVCVKMVIDNMSPWGQVHPTRITLEISF